MTAVGLNSGFPMVTLENQSDSRCPEVPLKVTLAPCPGVATDTGTAAPPSVPDADASAGTEYTVAVIEPALEDCGSSSSL